MVAINSHGQIFHKKAHDSLGQAEESEKDAKVVISYMLIFFRSERGGVRQPAEADQVENDSAVAVEKAINDAVAIDLPVLFDC